MDEPAFNADGLVAFMLQVLQFLLASFLSPLFAPLGGLFFLNLDV